MNINKYRYTVGLFVILALAYSTITMITPPDTQELNKYSLSASEAKVLSLTIIVPYVAIWFTALYGYLKLKKYTETIKKTKDGKAMAKIAEGLLVLAISMPISAVVASAGTYFARQYPDLLPATTIINNYLNLTFALLAFYIIYQGAKRLPAVLKKYKIKMSLGSFIPLFFVAFSAMYVYFTLTSPVREHPTESVARAAYYLPDWLLIVSVVIPYIVVWYLGFRSVQYINAYLLHVPGNLYKRALRYLANGIFFAVLSIIALRFLTSMTAWFNDQGLKIVLSVIYLLLILIAIGYILIAKGAKELQKIEEAV